MVNPVLDGSTAPPAAVRRENDLAVVNPVLDGSTVASIGFGVGDERAEGAGGL